jgi:hypothetical protein
MLSSIRSKLKKVDFIYKPYMALKWKTVLKWQHQKKVAKFQKNGYTVLNEIEHALEESGLETFLAFGTLLGFVREGGLIAYDDDIDICVINKGKNEWEILDDVMKKCGLMMTREFFYKENRAIATYSRDGVNVDFYLFEVRDGRYMTYSFWPVDKNQKYQYGIYEDYKIVEHFYPTPVGIHSEMIHDTFVLLPQNGEEILEALYGKDWRTPDPNYSVENEVKCIDKVKAVYYG